MPHEAHIDHILRCQLIHILEIHGTVGPRIAAQEIESVMLDWLDARLNGVRTIHTTEEGEEECYSKTIWNPS